MPTIEISLSDLNRLIGERYSLDELRKPLRNLGIEVEGMTPEGNVKIEVHHDRPDLLGIEGLARILKGYLGKEIGNPEYELKDPKIECEVDPSLEGKRPVAVMGQIENAEFDDVSVKALMDLQEKLHKVLGRDREKISIGAYDIDGIEPPIQYTTTSPDGEGFVPLEFEEKLSPQEILEKHPKGKKYAHLIEDYDRYPLLTGSNGKVLSMPPIINSEACRLKEDVTNIGLDVTGIDQEVAEQALEIIMSAAAERGFDIRAVKVKRPDSEIVTPRMENKERSFDLKNANDKLGLDLNSEEASNIMKKMRYDIVEQKNNKIRVKIPFYRYDIMHESDLFEDLAVGYGYDNLEPELPSIEITGKPHEIEKTSQIARRTLTGLGFMEAMPYILTSPELNFRQMNIEGDAVRVENPISKEYSIIRTWLLPGLMDVLRENRLHELPQKFFEVGDVALLDESAETGAENVRRVAAVAIGEEMDYTYTRSILEALLREFRLDWEVDSFEHPSFLDTRTAQILVNGARKGFIGEIHPEVITNFDLEHPVVAFELDLPQ